MSGLSDFLSAGAETRLTLADPSRHAGGLPTRKSPMSQNMFVLVVSSLISVVVGCSERKIEPPPPKATAEQEPGKAAHQKGNTPQTETSAPHQLTVPPQALEGQTFQTAVVERRDFRDEIQATASIKPNEYRLFHLSPRIEGRVIDVMAELGDSVKQGQALALFDSIELGQKKAAFLQGVTNRDVDYRNYTREKGLFEQRISSEKEYVEAKGTYEKSMASYRAAYEALRLVGLSDDDIKKIGWSGKGKALSSFALVAPQAGTVIERNITRGELLTPKAVSYTHLTLPRAI